MCEWIHLKIKFQNFLCIPRGIYDVRRKNDEHSSITLTPGYCSYPSSKPIAWVASSGNLRNLGWAIKHNLCRSNLFPTATCVPNEERNITNCIVGRGDNFWAQGPLFQGNKRSPEYTYFLHISKTITATTLLQPYYKKYSYRGTRYITMNMHKSGSHWMVHSRYHITIFHAVPYPEWIWHTSLQGFLAWSEVDILPDKQALLSHFIYFR